MKWILVICFGYLGYKNARFGKVAAHIAVCAFARETLLKTVRMAEERGLEFVHGIVDSLWLKKEGACPREYVDLCRLVSKEIGVQLNVEGRYRWIVFLPSRMHVDVPVLNWYYGVFESGKIKVRGIEAVRRDTLALIRDAQNKEAGKRVKAAELIDDGTPFDGEKYVDMLILAATNILSLFGYTEERLKDEIFYGEKQAVLQPTLKMHAN